MEMESEKGWGPKAPSPSQVSPPCLSCGVWAARLCRRLLRFAAECFAKGWGRGEGGWPRIPLSKENEFSYKEGCACGGDYGRDLRWASSATISATTASKTWSMISGPAW